MKKTLALSVLSVVTLLSVACGGSNSSHTSSQTPSSEATSSIRVEEDNKVHLVILAGQSGARGKALVNDLDEEDKEVNENVDIMQDGLTMPQLSRIPSSPEGELVPLTVGFGDSAGEFGPEIGIGKTLASRYPKNGADRKSVIVKYSACGSTFTDHWYSKSTVDDPELSDYLNQDQICPQGDDYFTGPLTSNLYQLITRTIEELENEGHEVVIDGVIFSHGEQDAKFDANMTIYERALTNFIKDLREYVGVNDLPFVITEAITNSAKYSNTLREIQARVAKNNTNVRFLDNSKLYSNTFEPWHLGAKSNIEMGNRAAAELISMNDLREVSSFLIDPIKVPLNADIKLPEFVNAEFKNGLTGYVKVEYTGTYDKTKEGSQTVPFKVQTLNDTFEGELPIEVGNYPYVDGNLNEYSSSKKNTVDGIGDIYVVKGEEGLTIAADIKDNEIWTDGEAWATGDMGQKDNNDDFRVYITTSDVDSAYTACLSSANLFRVYDQGVKLSSSNLAKDNLVYRKMISNFDYRAHTDGFVNINGNDSKTNATEFEGKEMTSSGMKLEFFIGYDDLGIDNPEDIKLCFNYSNISKVNSAKTTNDVYYSVGNGDASNIANYFAINDLI